MFDIQADNNFWDKLDGRTLKIIVTKEKTGVDRDTRVVFGHDEKSNELFILRVDQSC